MNPTHDDNKLAEKFAQNDLPDSKHDKELLKGDEATIDLPDVEDIPGQEHIHVPKMNEYADTTASSADEEGDDLFDEDESDDSNVSEEEKKFLDKMANETPNDEEAADVKMAALDDMDNDGELLEEKGLEEDEFGEDLDLPENEETTEEETEE